MKSKPATAAPARETQQTKGTPVSIKFEVPEETAIRALARQSGLSVSEIVRRSARCLRFHLDDLTREQAADFLINDLAPENPPPNE